MPTFAGSRTFSALSVRNFRRFMAGQFVSMSGTWMQAIALAVLVLQISGRGAAVGVAFSLQYLPVLLLAPFGGVIADRVNRRRALFGTQAISGLLALILGLLVVTHSVQLWMVYAMATSLGLVNAFDIPIRQSFVYEMVGPEHVTNAVSINVAMVNLARVLGPALGGAIIATAGLATCFFYNAASFGAVIIGLTLIRSGELHHSPRVERADGRMRDGFRYVRETPELLIPLLMLAIVGTLAFEFPVSLPLFATFTFHRGAGLFSALTAVYSVGAITGVLLVAGRVRPNRRSMCMASVVFGFAMLAAAFAPTIPLALVAMVPMGITGFILLVLTQGTLQLTTSPAMRGRVMGLMTVAVAGSSAIGGPIVGWIADNLGARYGLAIGGVSALVAALLGYWTLLRQHPTEPVSQTDLNVSLAN